MRSAATSEYPTEPPKRPFLSRPRYRASLTADVNVAERAGEMHLPPEKRLFNDPFAQYFMQSRVGRFLTAAGPLARLALPIYDYLYAGNHAHVILRNRLYEEELSTALDAGTDQVVLLGAGFDSSAFRIDMGTAKLFDVDTAPTHKAKRRSAQRAGLTPLTQVIYVDCDFESDRPSDRLIESGFEPSRPTLFVWLGVMYYLSQDAAEETLRQIGDLSAPETTLVADYVDVSVIEGTTPHPGARRSMKSLDRRGEPLRFGLSAPAASDLLCRHGFEVARSLRVPDLADQYGPPMGVWCRQDDWFGTLVGRRVQPMLP